MSQVKFDMSGLTRIISGLKDAEFKVRVGILGTNASGQHKGTSMTNAEIGAIQEFGSYSMIIPIRSFLRYPLQTKMPEWLNSNKEEYYRLLKDGDVRKFFVGMGFGAEKIIDEAFASSGYGTWQPNLPITIARKGSALPLVDTGQLRNSITSKVMRKDKRE